MKFFLGLILIILNSTSCKNNSSDTKIDQAEINENLTKMNRIIVENESKRIDDFIKSHSFQTSMTGTGLRYEVYKHGKGEGPGIRSEVEIIYKVFLLDGTLCYSNDSANPSKIRLGVGEQVRGLEEGIMLMIPGDNAHLILPSHLGYGMTGDHLKIPPGSALFFDVELLNVNK